jgi:hypothetical protein
MQNGKWKVRNVRVRAVKVGMRLKIEQEETQRTKLSYDPPQMASDRKRVERVKTESSDSLGVGPSANSAPGSYPRRFNQCRDLLAE